MELSFFWLPTSEGKGILGELDDRGVLSFAIQAGPTSSIRGTEMFNRMLDFFGDRVNSIRGYWLKRLDEPSTNIDKVNELLEAGLPLGQAIQHAWTVTRARKRGFVHLAIVDAVESSPGFYRKVEVLMTR